MSQQGKLPLTPPSGEEPPAPPAPTPAELETLPALPDRAEIAEMTNRILALLPQAGKIGQAGAMALAQVALYLHLNPFTGEVWAIPSKTGGIHIMVGIKGLRRAARRQCQETGAAYWTYFRPCRDEELAGAELKPGDIARACELYKITPASLAAVRAGAKLLPFTGLGLYRHGEDTRMQPLMVARKRAEADALKQAFDCAPPPGVATALDFTVEDDSEDLEPPALGKQLDAHSAWADLFPEEDTP